MKNFETGYVGEKIAFTVIKEKFKDDVVLWVNEESETRKPYDIVVAKKDSNRIDYYEVKATVVCLNCFLIFFNNFIFTKLIHT